MIFLHSLAVKQDISNKPHNNDPHAGFSLQLQLWLRLWLWLWLLGTVVVMVMVMAMAILADCSKCVKRSSISAIIDMASNRHNRHDI